MISTIILLPGSFVSFIITCYLVDFTFTNLRETSVFNLQKVLSDDTARSAISYPASVKVLSREVGFKGTLSR